MGWRSGTVMDSRLEFVRLAEAGGVSISELCRRFGVSRQTGHVWLKRYREAGEAGLCERSSRPQRSPRQTAAAMEERILALRAAHPAWGGRKLVRRLRDQGVAPEDGEVPAASTATAVLRRHGKLVGPEGPADAPARQRFERSAPNELWQMDFKGHVAMDQGRCHPLTVLDDHSRFLVGLFACAQETEETVRPHLTTLFRRSGLPQAILCDNGPPWGSSDGDALTDLEVWLLRLSVRMYHGRPYHPQTQGKDERFHRTLKVEVLQGRRMADLARCQPVFDRFREVYNTERPHEALGMAVPISRYQPSPAPFPAELPRPDYHASDLVRRVRPDGAVTFERRRVKLPQALGLLDVAFRPTATDGLYTVYFMRFPIAEVDLRGAQVVRARCRRARLDEAAPAPGTAP